jgi:acetyl-CoA acyltransferase 1
MLSAMALLRNAPSLGRAASTQAGPGLSTILQRNRNDVVLTFAKRTATGKTKKGQFKDVPVDEMLRALFKVRSSDVVQ